MKKPLMILTIAFFSITTKAQLNIPKIQEQQTFAFQGYKTSLGLGFGVEYNYYVMDNTALGIRVNYDWGRPYQAYYNSVGLDLGGNFAPLPIGDSFFINLKLFGSLAFQKITDKGMIEKSVFNYGGKGGGGIEYFFSSGTAIEIYGLQAIMAKPDLGKKTFEIGATLKFVIN